MGFVRGSFLFVVSIIIIISLLVMNFFVVMYLALDYNILKPELKIAIKEIADNEMNISQKIGEKYPEMISNCKNNSDYSFYNNLISESTTIPCSVISEGQEAIIEYEVDDLVNQSYYREYDCNFWDCFQKTESPFFLFSLKAKNYWGGNFFIALIFSLIFIALAFFLVENKTNFPILIGFLMILSILPFINFELFFYPLSGLFSFSGSLASQESNIFFMVVKSMFSFISVVSLKVFKIMLTLAIVLIIIGLVLKFMNFSFIKRVVLRQEIKEAVREEVTKTKVRK